MQLVPKKQQCGLLANLTLLGGWQGAWWATALVSSISTDELVLVSHFAIFISFSSTQLEAGKGEPHSYYQEMAAFNGTDPKWVLNVVSRGGKSGNRPGLQACTSLQ